MRRLNSVDFARGVVMVVMALDHARGMISNAMIDPMDLSKTNAALFLTRWITHFCAPAFVFLAGTAAFLCATRGKSKADLSRFLWTRGLWLIVLEFTLVRFGWAFNFNYTGLAAAVIWAIGCSMIVLAGLVYLPTSAVGVFGVAMIALHNLLDPIQAKSLGPFAWQWGILHGGYSFDIAPGLKFAPVYPLVPWMGVMAAGYAFGALLLLNPAKRWKTLLRLGLFLALAFVVLRAINIYGDPRPWSEQRNGLFTIFSFVNCTKYPPSLLFLLMTLGPAIALVGLFEWAQTRRQDGCPFESWSRPIVVFGRVPMFYYLLHLPLIHLMAALLSWPAGWGSFYFTRPPAGYGHDLWVVYLAWVIVVALLYPLCRWFAQIKSRRRDWWLSYL